MELTFQWIETDNRKGSKLNNLEKSSEDNGAGGG